MTAAPRRSLPPWLPVKALFDRLLDLPAAQRVAALANAGASAAVVAQALELLAQHEAEEQGGAAFLGAPARLRPAAVVDRRGQRLGPWALTAPLGSGGMGEVWDARRADGAYDARVAIKVVRAGADSAALLERFAHEQRLLARLNHPHIARLLDAGHTDDGHPYVVLEAVDGRPFDEACRRGRACNCSCNSPTPWPTPPPPAGAPRPQTRQRAGDR
ncbi:MAG: protein kinase [Rubrivivax sp.]|nr:protein kinase [Rubrivivax sp.]